jgi:hypothetical protein
LNQGLFLSWTNWQKAVPPLACSQNAELIDMRNNLIKMLIALIVCACLTVAMVFNFTRGQERPVEFLQTKSIRTLHDEFKQGTPSFRFLDAARQLGAISVSVTNADRSSKNGSVPAMITANCHNSHDFNELNSRFNSQIDGSAQAIFEEFGNSCSFEINIKNGKVTKAIPFRLKRD